MTINRINDVLFKWIFGNTERKDILIHFINAVLADGAEEDVIADIELIDRELDSQNYEDKQSRLDILGKTTDGKIVNIEIQAKNESNIAKRSMYYWAKLYSDQLKKGMKYEELCQTITINILNFNYLPSEEYHNQFIILEKNQHYPLDDNLQIHFLELKKWTKLSIKTSNRLERWLLYLADNDPIELEEVATVDEVIHKALEAEKKFLSDEQARYLYNMREKAEMDYLSGMASARDNGIKEGISQGISQGIREGALLIATKMLAKGSSIQEIMDLTDLPESEIIKLVKQ